MRTNYLKSFFATIMVVILISTVITVNAGESIYEVDEEFTSSQSAAYSMFTIDMWMAQDDARTTLALLFNLIISAHYLNEAPNEPEKDKFDDIFSSAVGYDKISVGKIDNTLFIMADAQEDGCVFLQYNFDKDGFYYIRTKQGRPTIPNIEQEERIDPTKLMNITKEYLEAMN